MAKVNGYNISYHVVSMFVLSAPVQVHTPLESNQTHTLSRLNVVHLLTNVSREQFWIGQRFYIGAWKSLKRGGANMDVLVALGTTISFLYSLGATIYALLHPEFERTWHCRSTRCLCSSATVPSIDWSHVTVVHAFFDTAAMLMTFILLGKYLETVAKGKTSDAISKLMSLKVVQRAILGAASKSEATNDANDGRDSDGRRKLQPC